MHPDLGKTLLKFVCLYALVVNGESKRILSVEFVGSKSHVMTYLPLLEELVNRGHEVTFAGPSESISLIQHPSITRKIPTFDFATLADPKDLDQSAFKMKEQNDNTNPFALFTTILPKYCLKIYDHPEIQKLMSQSEPPFDLIMTQPIFNECSFGFIHNVSQKGQGNTPLVLFSPAYAPSFLVSYLGGHHPPSSIPNVFLSLKPGAVMTFCERFMNFGFTLFLEGLLRFYFVPSMEDLYRQKLGADYPSAAEVLGKASLILSNGHFSTSGPKPNLPDVVDVGGIHSRPARPLPPDLESFISSSNEGFIYFSLGTGLKGGQMSEEKRQILISVFSKLRQQVVWKNEVELPNLPKNIYTSKWLPQQDLLGHKKIKLFITHCGGGSTEEAIYHGVPLIGMPFFGDQPLNAKQAESQGILLKLEWNDMTEETLLRAINEVLSNHSYRDSVQRLSAIFKDRPIPPLDLGVHWIEYVMRHAGAPALRSPARSLNFIQYHSLDIIASYLLIIYAVFWFARFMFKAIVRKVFRREQVKKGTVNHQKQE